MKNKKVFIVLIAIFFFIWISIYLFGNKVENNNCYIDYVEKVYDWDTVYGKKLGKIRLLGIDAPEIYHPGFTKIKDYKFYGCWKESKEFAEKYLYHKNIKFCYDKIGNKTWGYGRKLMYAFVDKNTTFWYLSIKTWLAFVYKYADFSKKKFYQQAEQEAKNKRIWVWSKKCILEDINFKIKMWIYKNLPKCYIKWNISSKWKKIYYLPWDPNYFKVKIDPKKWEKYFCNIKEAEKEWFIRIWYK